MFKSRKPIPSFITACLVLITFLIFSRFFKTVVTSLFSLPLEIASDFIADARGLISYRFILARNEALVKEVSRLRSGEISAKELRLENERLKKLLSLKQVSEYKTVAARVVARDPNNWSMGVIINKGSGSGIKEGALAINDAGLVGRVVEVGAAVSKIILINDPDNSIGAIIQRSREEALVSGTLMGEVVARYLDKDSDVKAGDMVLVSSYVRDKLPAIPVGRVEEVREEAQGQGKYCRLRPFADLKRIEELLVVISGRQD